MMTNTFFNNCNRSTGIRLPCGHVPAILSPHRGTTFQLLALYLLYTRSIPALYLPCICPVYWLLPLNAQGASPLLISTYAKSCTMLLQN